MLASNRNGRDVRYQPTHIVKKKNDYDSNHALDY
jgi:hypothetical protein